MADVTAPQSLAAPRAILAAVTTVSRDPRSAILLGAAVLGLLLGACAASPTSSPVDGSPAPGPTGAPSASATAGPTDVASVEPSSEASGPTGAACTALDLKVSHGLVEGTAGSRDTEVVLVTAVRCAVPASPAFAIRDAAGATVALSTPAGQDVLVVRPGGRYASDVQFANWCGDDPDYPLTLELRLDGESIAVTDGPFPESGDVPPCTAGDAPTLSASAWAPSS